MNQDHSQERRRDPRLENNIPLKIKLDGGDVVTETVNISRSGAYCRVTEYIEPMTKLDIHLLLPVRKNGKDVTKKVACQGVVVRVEPVDQTTNFNIAVFFNDITQRDSETIADYIGSHLEGQSN
ncbi:MAG: PilZ domain-containing protein [Candidatus Omnitrophica bacterium]|nr:PilZ domain-containing protein [Candidatus Omnitrophota bacterium]